MNDLITFFRERLDEEYASADMLAVQGTRWLAHAHFPGVVVSDYGHAVARCNEDELPGAALRARHIARYDPGHAKRDIAADRALLAEYARIAESAGRYQNGENIAALVAMEAVVRIRATRFSPHPGYLPEWAPAPARVS